MKTLLTSLIFATLAFAQESQQSRVVKCGVTSGTANAQTCTATPTITSYVVDRIYEFTIGSGLANTATMTIDMDGVGPVALVKLGGAINTALIANDVRPGQHVLAKYDGTNMQMISQTGNAAAGGGGAYTIQWSLANGGISASANNQFYGLGTGTSVNGTEANRRTPIGVSGTVSKLYVTCNNNQAGDALIATVYVNGSAGPTCSILSGQPSCSDLVTSTSITAGQGVTLKFQNTYAGTSCLLQGASVTITPTP